MVCSFPGQSTFLGNWPIVSKIFEKSGVYPWHVSCNSFRLFHMPGTPTHNPPQCTRKLCWILKRYWETLWAKKRAEVYQFLKWMDFSPVYQITSKRIQRKKSDSLWVGLRCTSAQVTSAQWYCKPRPLESSYFLFFPLLTYDIHQ